MSALCNIALALRLAVNACEPVPPVELPEGDSFVWDYQRPEAPAPLPEPEAPKIVERVVVREIVREVPAPTPAPETVDRRGETVEPPEPPQGFDIAAVDRFYRQRREGSLLAGEGAEARGTLGDGRDAPGLRQPGPQQRLGGSAPALAAPARYIHPGRIGGDPVDNTRILAEDRYITGILETSINTQLDGSVIIQTSRDVFGYHGKRVLLPKGSRMVCGYTSPKKIGEHRIGLVCDRVLTAGRRAEIFQVAAPVGDIQGRTGITGDVDNRFLESYGSAFILTFISASVRAAIASAADSDSRDSDDLIINETGEEISTRFGEITASVLQRSLNLKPIITVPQGTRVQIRPSSDWYIRLAEEG